ncbi:MAG TPA: phage baseplate upper protein [Staphylococcus ureilyticus]|uniref:BppU family phage baseplate upper protein n=1 Tax=Staphylococcus ureilyticus TaxID=94138 RepID=UPI001D76B7F2|nr:BppU family phage baseplate upper protein [Staphylococcus ureilyticus]HJG66633.1 phage baseplate upper protein [Staphylococcus ureilyticus]
MLKRDVHLKKIGRVKLDTDLRLKEILITNYGYYVSDHNTVILEIELQKNGSPLLLDVNVQAIALVEVNNGIVEKELQALDRLNGQYFIDFNDIKANSTIQVYINGGDTQLVTRKFTVNVEKDIAYTYNYESKTI